MYFLCLPVCPFARLGCVYKHNNILIDVYTFIVCDYIVATETLYAYVIRFCSVQLCVYYFIQIDIEFDTEVLNLILKDPLASLPSGQLTTCHAGKALSARRQE